MINSFIFLDWIIPANKKLNHKRQEVLLNTTNKNNKCLCFLVSILILVSTITTAWASSPNQIVSSVPATLNAYTQQCIEIDLVYSVSDNNSDLNGLGFMIHYDTDFFSSPALVNSITGLMGKAYISDESPSDTDNDSSTDKTISIAWFDFQANWPGEPLPITISTLMITTNNDLSIGDQSVLRITPTSTHLGYGLSAMPVTVTIVDPDQGPIVVQSLDDIVVDEDAAAQSINLSQVFSDIDNDDAQIVKTIQSNTNPALISATVNDHVLILEYMENQNGSAEIVILALSNGKRISDTFAILVNAVNDPPSISAISDQEVEDTSVRIDYTINDIETASENLTITLQSSAPDILPVLPENVLMSGMSVSRSITLTPVEGAYGSCMLTLVVMDSSSRSSTAFSFKNSRPSFTIVTLADGNGSISPSGIITILKGTNKTFSIVPSTGNRVDDILINDNSVGSKNQYTFWSIAQNYTIQAIFNPIPAPVADFYAEPISGDVPLVVDFVNTSQNEFTSAQWQFGDNRISNVMNPSHTYALPGQYTVCLKVTGQGGTHALTKTAYIQVNEGCDLSIQFSANKRIVPIQTDIQMTANVSENSADLIWDFGDGTNSQQRNPIHAYATPGRYDVSLTAIGSAQNCSVTTIKSEYIQVVGRSIFGQVQLKGNAVAGCLVSLWKNKTRMEDFALTDENGDYAFENLPAISGWVISVMPPSSLGDQYLFQYYPNAILWADAETISTENQEKNITIHLIEPPDNGICGKIYNGTTGISDALVSIYSESLDLARTVRSDIQGNYTITGLPMASDYVVSAFLETIKQEYYYAIPQGLTPGESIPENSVTRYTRATPIEPDAPCIQHIDIIMQNAQISGTVISDGQPVSNVQVYAWSTDMNCDNFSTTNGNGQYTITGLIAVSETDAPTKGYILELQSAGYPYQVYDNQTDIEQATRIETGRQDINFQLYTDRKLSGRITDINQSPLAEAFIQIKSAEADILAQTYSNENGNYTFSHLPVASDYLVYAYVQNYPLQYYQNVAKSDLALPVNLFGDHADNIDFIMDKGPVIKGQVTYLDTGLPVEEGIWVNISSEKTNSGGDVPTDENGHYEITGLDPDINDYVVSIWHQDYVNVFYSSSGSVYQYTRATPIAPSDDNRNLSLTSGFCIKGEISYLQATIEGIQVWADGPTSGTTMSLSKTVNDSNYEICGLSPGRYEVNILSDQYLDHTYPNPVIISDSNQTDIDFQLIVPYRRLGGTIYQADLEETIRLFATSSECQEVIRITGTGEPVGFTFSNLQPASDYRLEIRPDNHDYQVYNNKTDLTDGTLIDLSDDNMDNIEITLTRSSAVIKGFIQFPDPLIQNDSVFITGVSDELNQQKTVEISPSGSGASVPYTLSGVGLDTNYEVRLISDFYEQQIKTINTLDAQPDNDVNFVLTSGGSISGQILNADNQGVSGINVMVWSDQLSLGKSAATDRQGNYQISGLNAASDYDVSVQVDTTTFYYHSDGTVVQSNKKGDVSLNQGQTVAEIDIKLFEGEKIEGIVRNINGIPIANVYISVALGPDSSGSDFTNDQGEYCIDNLQHAMDYTVEAIPDNALGYIRQVKTSIQSNSQQVNFVLQKGYSLSGQVNRWDQTHVANAIVEISSISQDCFPPTVSSDSQGHYEIMGLPSASDYILQVTPPFDSQLSMFQNQNLLIEDNTSFLVTLSSALCISGTVRIADPIESIAYTKTARINIYSHDDFDQWTESDAQGNFILCHVPDTTSYSINVYAEGYVDQSVYQIYAGENVNIELSIAKRAFGEVKNSRGQAISNARIEIYSAMMNLKKSTVSLADGTFEIEGLPEYYNGFLVEDYCALVTANGYPDTRKNHIVLNTQIPIVLEADASLFIGGTVSDINDNPLPNGLSVNVRLYEKNQNSDSVHMKVKQNLNNDGTFMFTGLDANKTYKLKFKQLDNDAGEKLKEWAGENNIGVEKKKDAVFYSPGETINFRFSEVWH